MRRSIAMENLYHNNNKRPAQIKLEIRSIAKVGRFASVPVTRKNPVCIRTPDFRMTNDIRPYFWHITDIHFNPHHGDAKKGCGRSEYDSVSSTRNQRRSMGKYGDYTCDAPWELIESASKTMMNRQNDNVDFVLWTG
ncbi:hypothetical protein Zmor_027990 [Zophobas morio]|uniref:Uncharacterized protein n=1 Tax=Zophobas morio TaxID=2755281 RepID=A0AA38M2K0_9CUCU|nr:hypothetical protein Zmor_027990 [Zophobas morio]